MLTILLSLGVPTKSGRGNLKGLFEIATGFALAMIIVMAFDNNLGAI